MEKSIAYDLGHTIPFGGIYLNAKFADEPRKKREIINEISNKLHEIGKVNNVKVDTWENPRLKKDKSYNGPDLIIGIDDWGCVLLKERLGGDVFVHESFSSRHTGSHRINGLFIATGPDIKKCRMESVGICDIAPTILYLFNCRISPGIDGHVLKDIFSEQYFQQYPPQLESDGTDDEKRDGHKHGDSSEESYEAEVKQQLKDLGYM